MLIYEGTKDNFLYSVDQDTSALEIENNIYKRTSSPHSEKRIS